MSAVREFVYISRDNTIDLELREDGLPENITSATRVRLELFDARDLGLAPIVIDSTINLTAFDWTTQGAAGILLIKLGDILTKANEYRARLALYDVASPNGELWAHEVTTGCFGTALLIQVLDATEAA